MSDLFGNHIVGFPTRRLNYVIIIGFEAFHSLICFVSSQDFLSKIYAHNTAVTTPLDLELEAPDIDMMLLLCMLLPN